MATIHHHLLLPIASDELAHVLYALNSYSEECERHGDVLGTAPKCDAVAERIRALEDLDHTVAVQFLLHAGVGRGKHRPQG